MGNDSETKDPKTTDADIKAEEQTVDYSEHHKVNEVAIPNNANEDDGIEVIDEPCEKGNENISSSKDHSEKSTSEEHSKDDHEDAKDKSGVAIDSDDDQKTPEASKENGYLEDDIEIITIGDAEPNESNSKEMLGENSSSETNVEE